MPPRTARCQTKKVVFSPGDELVEVEQIFSSSLDIIEASIGMRAAGYRRDNFSPARRATRSFSRGEVARRAPPVPHTDFHGQQMLRRGVSATHYRFAACRCPLTRPIYRPSAMHVPTSTTSSRAESYICHRHADLFSSILH